MSQNSTSQQLYDLLVTKNFDVQALDSATGRGPVDDQGQPDIAESDEYRFDFVAQSGRNYGSVVILLGSDNNLVMFFGDNVGKTMEGQDKQEWFDFMYQIKQFATKNFLNFQPENISKLKYTKQGQAAIKEGLFESWQGRGSVSWNGKPTEARLVIKHKKALAEGEARFRYIESIYIETADSERFKMKSRNLTAAKAMLEHVRQGGNPYDARGMHINEIVEELSVLSRFRRANAGKLLEGETKQLVEQTDAYYRNMHSILKHLGSSRGYQSYFESWNPAEVTGGDLVIEDIKNLFVKQTIDHRIEEALPILARITQEANAMKEAQIFESWINNLAEGTWALPETPEEKQTLIDLLTKEFPVGADAMNATEQLYDVLGDDELFDRLSELAAADANADARSVIMARMEELSSRSPDIEAVLGQLQTTAPEPTAQPAAGNTKGPQSMEEDLSRRGFLRGLGAAAAGAAGLGAADAMASDKDPEFMRRVQDKHYEMLEKNPRYANEHAALKVMLVRGITKSDQEINRRWAQKTAELLQKYGVKVNEDMAEARTCNMTEAGEYCPEHGLQECGVYEYTGNPTNFGLEESDQLTQLRRLALGK